MFGSGKIVEREHNKNVEKESGKIVERGSGKLVEMESGKFVKKKEIGKTVMGKMREMTFVRVEKMVCHCLIISRL